MKEYKVIKEFGCAQKGDVLKEKEEGFFEICEECVCDDCHCSRTMCISTDIASTLLSAGYLAEVEEQGECDCCKKLQEIIDYVDGLIQQYGEDHEALLKQYNEGDVPQCVKVEADTVYFNLDKVLNHIKDLLNE